MTAVLVGVLSGALFFFGRLMLLKNGAFGFADTALYPQAMVLLKAGWNPIIPTFAKPLWAVRQQPILWALSLLGPIAQSPLFFIGLDTVCVLAAAWICRKTVWRLTAQKYWGDVAFFAVLWCPLLTASLHISTQATLWALIPWSLLLSQYLLHREPWKIFLYSVLICVCDLGLGWILIVLALCFDWSRLSHWIWRRRIQWTLASGGVGAVALLILHLSGLGIQFQTSLFWQIHGAKLWTLGICFLFLPIFQWEVWALTLGIMMASVSHTLANPAILVPVACLFGFREATKLRLDRGLASVIISVGVLLAVTLQQLNGADSFFHFWNLARWKVSRDGMVMAAMVAQVPQHATVAASDRITPLLSSNSRMIELLSAKALGLKPQYVLTWGEIVSFDQGSAYKVVYRDAASGAALLKRIQ